MLRWTRKYDASDAGPSSSTVVCHFCSNRLALASNFGKGKASQRLPVVTGSWSSFRCSICQSWNLRDPSTGDFVQDARIYSDSSLNPPKSGRAEGPRAAASSFVFCSNCQTNQQLQVQLLAGYLPPDVSLQEEEQRLQHLEAYKASLDERYPIVCELCAEKVEQVIEERNVKAKARTVGGWLKRTTVEDVMDARPGHQGRHVRIWRIKAVLWHSQYLATAFICIDRALQDHSYFDSPAIRALRTSSSLSAIKLFLLSIAGLLWSFWDPTYLKRNHRQTNVRGQGRWLCLQAMMFMTRIVLSLACLSGKSIPNAVWYLPACLHISLMLFKNRIIYTIGPRRVHLVHRSRPSSPKKRIFSSSTHPPQEGRSPARSVHQHPVFGKSAFSGAQSEPLLGKKALPSAQLAEEESNSMEWQPTQAASMFRQNPNSMDIDMSENVDQCDPKPPLYLKPAIFDPSSENWHESSLGAIRGLERLFEQGVSLSEPAFMPEAASIMPDTIGRRSMIYAGSLLVLALGMVAIHTRLTI